MIYQWMLALFCLGLPFLTKFRIFGCMCGITTPSGKLALIGAVFSFLGYAWWRKNGFPYVLFVTMLLCLLMALLFSGDRHPCSKLMLHESEYTRPHRSE